MQPGETNFQKIGATFRPIFRNPHLLTIVGNFWPRKIDERRFPSVVKHYRIDAATTIVVFEHQPAIAPRGQLLFLHGLEGSANAGYILSCAQEALVRGFGVHRVNFRTCGGTEELCETAYHSGLTSDIRAIAQQIETRRIGPIFLVGFSLGGNVALKLAGELGETRLLAGTCAISTPIDLAACVRCIGKRSNAIYARRFLARLRDRVRKKSRISPAIYRTDGLEQVKTIWEFDDRFTAPLFGFGTAANYYKTQSAIRYLNAIRIPALVICAKDDPLVPFEIYDHSAFRSNPALRMIPTEYGGHLGFVSRRKPRFWLDTVIMDWINGLSSSTMRDGTNVECTTSGK